MKRWAVRLDVICESHESALAYAERLNQALTAKQIPLPKGYLLAEIGIGEGDYDPTLPPDHPIRELTVREGGEDA